MASSCGYCQQKTRGPLASVYWAWFDQEHERVAFRVKYCSRHGAAVLHPLFMAWLDRVNNDFGQLCLTCGELLEQEDATLWARVYLPGQEERDLSAEQCGSCLAKLTAEIIEHGEQLKNRSEFAPARANDAWAAIGILPVAAD